MQGFSLDMIKLSSAQLVLSQKSQLFVWWTLFQKMSWEFFLHRPMERNDILPPPLMTRHTWGSWFKQTWIFTDNPRMLPRKFRLYWPSGFWEKDLYNFLNIFLCTTPPPHCGPIQPRGMWFKWNIHYLGMLPHKYKLICSNVFRRSFLKYLQIFISF